VFGERGLELRDSDVGLVLPERLESKRRIRQRGSARRMESQDDLELRRAGAGRGSGVGLELQRLSEAE